MTDSQEVAPRMYPYGPVYDEALAELADSRRNGEHHIPTFARGMLEHLMEVGLLHTLDAESSVNVRKVRLAKGGNEQEVWVRFDTRRALAGYADVEVIDAPRSDTAILAAMIAWLARPVDFRELFAALLSSHSAADKAREQKVEESIRRMREDQDVTFEEWQETGKLLPEQYARNKILEPLDYMLPLLAHYRPNFDDCSPKEQIELLAKATGYINDFLESLRKLQGFLEYGAPSRKLTPIIKDPRRDVRAAVLHDVDGLTYREIGERTRVPLDPESDYYKQKGEHVTVRKMVERGREILEKAFGEGGWKERAKAMKDDMTLWRSLSKEARDRERDLDELARDENVTLKEVRRRFG